MMPPPRQSKTCVENIKKKFENVNLSEAANAPVNKANLPSKPQSTRGSEEEGCKSPVSKSESPRKRKPTGVINGEVLESSHNPSPPVKIVPLRVDRQISSPTSRNIRRSPAFRCDKVVRARNIISQSACRYSPKSVVVKRVKQFDDQSVELESSALYNENQTEKPPVSWRSKLKNDSLEPPINKLSKSPVSSDGGSTLSPKTDKLEVEKISSLPSNKPSIDRKEDYGICSAIDNGRNDNFHSTPFRKTSNRPLTVQERTQKDFVVNKIEKPLRTITNSKGKDLKLNIFGESGKQFREADQSTSPVLKCDDMSAAVKAVLESPLPSGPPPKKPPRTFAHVAVKKQNGNISAISPHQSPLSGDTSPLSVITKPIRSKTESQILLRKLENALSGISVQKPFSPPHFNNEMDYNSKKDISPEMLSKKQPSKNLKGHAPTFKLGNCFNSLYCAGDSSVYAKIVSPGLESDHSGDSMTRGKGHTKLYGTLHKAHSEEHIYAEPFEHMNRQDGGTDQQTSSFSSDMGISIRRSNNHHTKSLTLKLKPCQEVNKAGGLHYLVRT